jgi:Cys-tRNA(Pro)/Cys-tRNA(Cys) deacylase
MKDALAIHRWLLAHQVHHEIVRLARPLTCAEELPETLPADPHHCVAVSLFQVTTGVGTEPVAVIASVAAPPVPGVVGGLLGARRVRAAPPFVVNAVTEYAAGLVCPLLLPYELTTLIDERLSRDLGTDVLLHTATGERHSALSLRAADLLTLLNGKTIDLTARPRVPRARDSRPAARPQPQRH